MADKRYTWGGLIWEQISGDKAKKQELPVLFRKKKKNTRRENLKKQIKELNELFRYIGDE